ncbi:MAG: hypothetical protein IPG96_07595 [Proteobacteria bacterium]|nr:hypothetical protein [Pseudomonadota bacterium]
MAVLGQLANDATKQAWSSCCGCGRIGEARVLLKKNVGVMKALNQALKSKQPDAPKQDLATAAEGVDQPEAEWQRYAR